MSVCDLTPGSRDLPGPGIYRLTERGPDIVICLISLARMVRQTLPGVDSENFQTQPARVLAPDECNCDFLSALEWRQANCFKALKKQVEWIGGRCALKRLVAAVLPDAGAADQIEIAYEPRGAPYLVHDPGLSVSISHAGDYAAAGLCRTPGARIGLDIERIGRTGLDTVMPVAFTEREIAATAGSPQQAARIWTVKEAYLKFIKTGFRENLKRVDVSSRPLVHNGVPMGGMAVESWQVGRRYCLSIVCSQIEAGRSLSRQDGCQPRAVGRELKHQVNRI
jgi:4'-phosphopantetheinyl transferase